MLNIKFKDLLQGDPILVDIEEIKDNVYSWHDSPSFTWYNTMEITSYCYDQFKDLLECDVISIKNDIVTLDFSNKDYEKLDQLRDSFLWAYAGYIAHSEYEKLFKDKVEVK